MARHTPHSTASRDNGGAGEGGGGTSHPAPLASKGKKHTQSPEKQAAAEAAYNVRLVAAFERAAQWHSVGSTPVNKGPEQAAPSAASTTRRQRRRSRSRSTSSAATRGSGKRVTFSAKPPQVIYFFDERSLTKAQRKRARRKGLLPKETWHPPRGRAGTAEAMQGAGAQESDPTTAAAVMAAAAATTAPLAAAASQPAHGRAARRRAHTQHNHHHTRQHRKGYVDASEQRRQRLRSRSRSSSGDEGVGGGAGGGAGAGSGVALRTSDTPWPGIVPPSPTELEALAAASPVPQQQPGAALAASAPSRLSELVADGGGGTQPPTTAGHVDKVSVAVSIVVACMHSICRHTHRTLCCN